MICIDVTLVWCWSFGSIHTFTDVLVICVSVEFIGKGRFLRVLIVIDLRSWSVGAGWLLLILELVNVLLHAADWDFKCLANVLLVWILVDIEHP